jgi:hypothetical protein
VQAAHFDGQDGKALTVFAVGASRRKKCAKIPGVRVSVVLSRKCPARAKRAHDFTSRGCKGRDVTAFKGIIRKFVKMLANLILWAYGMH